MFKRKLSLAVALLISGAVQAAAPLTIDVHRDANCGCCKEWVKHLESSGFNVVDHVENDMNAIKKNLGVPQDLASCHTAVIDGKFVEGHVPAEEIKKLSARADLVGIAVPGMPAGSPGMEYGQNHQPYKVLGVTKEGAQEVVAEYPISR
ncbi:Uncharacterized conserved protein [Pseudomonas syringae]|uniref:Metal-binding protein n=2 Tax=Pseudomonas syringae group genomosp. 3 TaxID=251701 RepID=A0A3M3N5L1_9PSED|nr:MULTISPECIES: DUF411 domain-containing protein [Pseudomonas syringae group]AKF47415.1 putative metal-binding protein [Pseudomonas syringae pv. syringae B301D]AKF48561.1 putative metal-binding protein [Pseudomonas syringae pv. syringae B301D]EXL30072.1 putative metal-binding protein [Pseudomonas syringae pv. syringae str. B301D-R]RMN39628.1 hypothetical protein ALQ59_200020 [Pseudomonas syringae pv. apii]RMN55019.1 hypothetical protein ALQ58_200429 [Pseudomonas syringae pv. apii]